MGTNGRTWLSPQGYEQARHEWRERRIRHLQELLLTAEVGARPADDGVAEAGMVLTVRFDDSPDVETFLLADGDASASAEMEVYSSASPIGRALVGAHEGDTRSALLPDGTTLTVTLVTAQPYQQHVPALG
jgi:transcription elongation factor GreA